MIRLRIREGERTRDVELEAVRVRFGRLPECEVRLESAGVSREHAELAGERGGWRVRDLGSRNGTRVNGEKIEDRVVVEGDEISLAEDVTIEVLRLGGRTAEDAAAPRAEAGAEDAGEPEPAARRPAAAPGFLRREKWRLVPASGDGEALALRRPITTFGREPGVGGVIDHASVSRVHARADAREGGWLLTDLKSSNGTFVNDERVLCTPVREGDRVRFGDIEYVLERRVGFDPGALFGNWRLVLIILAVLLAAAWGVSFVLEHEQTSRVEQSFRHEAAASLAEAAREAGAGSADVARGHLAHAADLVKLAGLAPAGATLDRPHDLFAEVLPDLPPEARDFDFASLTSGQALASEQASVEALDNPRFVEHELRRYCAELGQDPNLPPEFVAQVQGYVDGFMRSPGDIRLMLRRARTLQPRIRALLAEQHLPEAVAYVAWVESRLDSMQVSPAGAVGLWQLMPATARERGLKVNTDILARDERTRVDKSTRAAARYLAEMLRDQGPEYFMLVLASYNRGHNALKALKQKIDDPMLGSTRKYWYLVERRMLTEETRMYVPKVFAIRIIAENPRRFGF
ncbi:MAG: FHA domain-containing protein [Candidatus Eisenbacteria bacterium]|nr:FHA domain-containing protein [Candidatus Eisenbacteria bacterium]